MWGHKTEGKPQQAVLSRTYLLIHTVSAACSTNEEGLLNVPEARDSASDRKSRSGALRDWLKLPASDQAESGGLSSRYVCSDKLKH